MEFCVTRFEPDGMYDERITAESWEDAERICDERGLRLDGEFMFEMSGDDMSDLRANEIIKALDARDWAALH